MGEPEVYPYTLHLEEIANTHTNTRAHTHAHIFFGPEQNGKMTFAEKLGPELLTLI